MSEFTYRQWLIGQCIAGVTANTSINLLFTDDERIAATAINIADEIIRITKYS